MHIPPLRNKWNMKQIEQVKQIFVKFDFVLEGFGEDQSPRSVMKVFLSMAPNANKKLLLWNFFDLIIKKR